MSNTAALSRVNRMREATARDLAAAPSPIRSVAMKAGVFFAVSAALPLLLGHACSAAAVAQGAGRTVSFPAPPHPDAIATEVGPIRTYIRQVTVDPPVHVRRYGLGYSELRGEIEGVGWGGQDAAGTLRQAHYGYKLAYVLRIPSRWDGTLVVHRHGTGPFALWQGLEASLGERNFARKFHETADRLVSDVALHPDRRWAFFAVNQTPVDPGGAFNTLVLPDDPSGGGAPVHSMLDVPIGRDTALLAKRLLLRLRGRAPDVTLGTGHSGGAFAHFMLNAGVDHLRTGVPPVLAGDNFVRPYDPASGRIFDGFLSLARGGGPIVPVDPVRGVSAPTLFLEGETDGAALLAVRQLDEMIAKGLDVAAATRLYMARNVPHVDADLVSTLVTQGRDFAGVLGLPEGYYGGAGERLKPLSAALLDALHAWATGGTPPPVSVFNGVAEDRDGLPGVDTLTFPRSAGPPSLAFPYVDDPSLDAIAFPPPTPTEHNPALAQAWDRVRGALGAATGSIVLPETACRRGGSSFVIQGPVGAWFTPFDEQAFADAWGSSAAHQTCRVGHIDGLASDGLYDVSVVAIDVQPEQFPNVVDLASTSRLPVAILSTPGFDATRVVPGSLKLAGASRQGATGKRPARVRRQDVNGDGRTDLVAEFEIAEVSIAAHDLVLDLWGRTRGGSPFTGSDTVVLAAASLP
jgi:hypothetical protein